MSEHIKKMYDEASPEDQASIRNHVLGPPPSNVLWVMVLLILAGVIFVGVWLGTVTDGSDETALYGFVGLALGAVVGLLSPPLKGASDTSRR
jgi:hypothetical protein